MNNPEYVYRLITPLGSSLHRGAGEVVQFPASLVRRAWFWRLFKVWVTVERRRADQTVWMHCFYRSADKLTKK